MSAAPGTLQHLLFHPSTRRVPADLERTRLADLRAAGKLWLQVPTVKMPREVLVPEVRRALEDDSRAAAVLASLSAYERDVLAAYCRLGGEADGAVIRLDLLARGLLKAVEGQASWQVRWQRNPVEALARVWVLLPTTKGRGHHRFGYQPETRRPFARYAVHAGLAKRVRPAGPPPWRVRTSGRAPDAPVIRSPGEVALDVARVFAFIAARPVKLTREGLLSGPAQRALAKAVPWPLPQDLPLPQPHGLYVELLRETGLLRVDGAHACAEEGVARLYFDMTTAEQARHWARAWLSMKRWWDGTGVGLDDAGMHDDGPGPRAAGRQVLTWALGCLAQGEDGWFDLADFLDALYALEGDTEPSWYGWRNLVWDPELPRQTMPADLTANARPSVWFSGRGAWYANALLGTLVALGFVARGRTAAGWCFRLTALGRAVFGAPEVAAPAEPIGEPFLVVQPNFDVVAYLDRATAAAAGMLGRLTEAGATNVGPVETCKLTQRSVYQVQEGGMALAEVIEFLRRHQRGELPANVLQTLAAWSARREAVVLTRGVTLLAFPAQAERDAYLAGHPGAACGDHFLVVRGSPAPPAGALVVDHARGGRRTLTLDEDGRFQASEPYDLLQRERLRRIAELVQERWRLNGDSVRRAGAAGDGLSLWRWLEEMLREPMPDLVVYGIAAWLGDRAEIAMAEAVLLHVPDADLAEAMSESRRLRPFLEGRIGRRWLVVRREARDALAAVLAELGFAVGRDLRFKTLDASEPDGRVESAGQP